jgi:geranylgeranyl pyrophosphate synthase
MTTDSLDDFFRQCRLRCENQLDQLLPDNSPAPLQQAMRYATLNGGKRIRPILSYATTELLGYPAEHVDNIGNAIELIHAYSLVHDDLPAMDNDVLRRGKPTCHIKYGEAQAILAGDALQAMAFELVVKQHPSITAATQLKIAQGLCQASGLSGMAAGQSLDLLSEGKTVSLEELETIHRKKTGALLEASVTLPAIACNADKNTLSHLTHFAQNLGLCFQVRDDVLDVIGDTETIGKTQGADINANKATFPALLGLEAAQNYAEDLHKKALAALNNIGGKTSRLREIADFIVLRKH